jgi:hypothetical protein
VRAIVAGSHSMAGFTSIPTMAILTMAIPGPWARARVRVRVRVRDSVRAWGRVRARVRVGVKCAP